MKRLLLVLSAFLFIAHTGFTQPEIAREDYSRAAGFLWQNLNNKKVFNLNVRINWFPDSTGFWFITHNKDSKTFNKVMFNEMKVEPLFDHSRLAALLSDSLNEETSAEDLPFNDVTYIDKNHLEIIAGRKTYRLDLRTYSLIHRKEAEKNFMESKSPDGKWIAYAENYNLFIKSTETGEVKQLSHSGKKNYEYASYYGWGDIMVGEGSERPPRFSVNWSPDSKWIQTNICDLGSAQKMYLLDWSVDTLYRARLLSYYRGSPGDTSMVYLIPVFFDISKGEEYNPGLPRNTHINSVNFRWSDTPGDVYASWSERGYKKVHLLKLNLNEKTKHELYSESSQTNIDNFSYWIAEKAGKIILTSEKDGWKQLYTVNLKDGKLSSLTNGAYYVEDIERINEKNNTLLFTASGKETGRNPYYDHLYKIGLSGKKLELLTQENAHHEVTISPDGKYFVDNISTVTQPTITVLRESAHGTIVMELSKADISAILSEEWKFPEVFTSTGRDGKTTIYGAIWKPTNFDPNRKYPVIDQTYTGPHTNMFPRSFVRGLSVSNQALAELGFIVVTVDGLGSAGRSKEFHNYSYKNMGKNLTDHVLAIKELGKRYSWMDVDRVGIFGHSAGGFDAAHGLLEFPDFYKVGVASSGDHDFRMEKAWWPEMYMGWPVDSTYQEVSNITMAGNLKGKLLITHGGIDENVNPSATFKLAEALVKANKQFDMLIFPGQHHGYTGDVQKYFTKKRWNYFIENLMGAQPLWDFDLDGN